MERTLKLKNAGLYATALTLALGLSTSSYAAGDTTTPSNDTSTTKSQPSEPTGKQKATAIGATGGAVAGAVVGGPIGAVVGGVAGAYVGHEGTDSHGRVPSSTSSRSSDNNVRRAQEALNAKGYSVGAVDGRWGPNTESAVRSFQEKNGIAASGTLDSATMSALGI
jgi:putative peptidoglycan binding protein